MVVARASFTIDRTGVMPLPAAKATTGAASSGSRKVPAGTVASSTSPGRTWSSIHVEPMPPGTRLTVVRSGSPRPGALDME